MKYLTLTPKGGPYNPLIDFMCAFGGKRERIIIVEYIISKLSAGSSFSNNMFPINNSILNRIKEVIQLLNILSLHPFLIIGRLIHVLR